MSKVVKFKEESKKGTIKYFIKVNHETIKCQKYYWVWSKEHKDWIRNGLIKKHKQVLVLSYKQDIIAVCTTFKKLIKFIKKSNDGKKLTNKDIDALSSRGKLNGYTIKPIKLNTIYENK